MRLTAKLIINLVHHGLGGGGGESFSSRLPKTALNSGFLPFDLTEKTSNLHLVLEGFFEKNCVNELCKKSTEKIIWHSHLRKKDHLFFYKSSANETFTISRNVVYFKKHLTY